MSFKISWEPEIKPANTVNSCVLCSEDYKGYGHNPWPLNGGRGRCCDTCIDYVLLARIARINRLAYGKKPNLKKEKMMARVIKANKAKQEILEKGELEVKIDDSFFTDFKNSLDMKV